VYDLTTRRKNSDTTPINHKDNGAEGFTILCKGLGWRL
jgi:hypothetical protein